MPSRREFLTSTALFGGLPALTTLGLTESLLAGDMPGAPTEYKLPKLPYPYEALEPYIDKKTMTIHHDKHHAGYTRGLNAALKKLAAARDKNDFGSIQPLSRALSFHAGGYVNHTIFWHNMAPAGSGGGGRPTGKLAGTIKSDFGGFEKFKAHFSAAAAKVEGNGWGVLGYHPLLKRLTVTQMMNQQDLNTVGLVPLLMLDVWEHAYYIKYQNRRKEYIENWWNVVNWSDVAQRYEAATVI